MRLQRFVWAAPDRTYRIGDFVVAGMSIVAFAIWSLAMPDSGWERWSVTEDNRQLAVVLAAAAAIVFSLFATGVEERMAAREALSEG